MCRGSPKRRLAALLLGLGLLGAACTDRADELAGTESVSSSAPHPTTSSTRAPLPSKTQQPTPESSSSKSPAPKASKPAVSPSQPLSSCPSPSVPADGMALPAYDCPNSHPSALLRGVRIEGDASTGCVWIAYPSGEHRIALWYPGYWARFDPVRIYDTRGRLVWSESDPPRDIGGGFVEVFWDRIPEQCRVDGHPRPWWVAPLSSNERSP